MFRQKGLGGRATSVLEKNEKVKVHLTPFGPLYFYSSFHGGMSHLSEKEKNIEDAFDAMRGMCHLSEKGKKIEDAFDAIGPHFNPSNISLYVRSFQKNKQNKNDINKIYQYNLHGAASEIRKNKWLSTRQPGHIFGCP